jgi:hypothetical protein
VSGGQEGLPYLLVALEPALAALVMVMGIVLTSTGVFAHAGLAVAPGALLTLLGGGWFGNCLARRDVRLFPGVSRN